MQALPRDPVPVASAPAPGAPAQGSPSAVPGAASDQGSPVPRQAHRPGSGPARWAPSRARLRGTPSPDAVLFTAPCPACGDACEWSELREDTRLVADVLCPCT